jgi:hypothetical protein
MPHDQNELCAEKFRQFDAHVRESIEVRDHVKDHNARLIVLEGYVKDQGNLRITIIGSSFSVIVVILLACVGWAVAWGSLGEKINRLEKLHPYGSALEDVGQKVNKYDNTPVRP